LRFWLRDVVVREARVVLAAVCAAVVAFFFTGLAEVAGRALARVLADVRRLPVELARVLRARAGVAVDA